MMKAEPVVGGQDWPERFQTKDGRTGRTGDENAGRPPTGTTSTLADLAMASGRGGLREAASPKQAHRV